MDLLEVYLVSGGVQLAMMKRRKKRIPVYTYNSSITSWFGSGSSKPSPIISHENSSLIPRVGSCKGGIVCWVSPNALFKGSDVTSSMPSVNIERSGTPWNGTSELGGFGGLFCDGALGEGTFAGSDGSWVLSNVSTWAIYPVSSPGIRMLHRVIWFDEGKRILKFQVQ